MAQVVAAGGRNGSERTNFTYSCGLLWRSSCQRRSERKWSLVRRYADPSQLTVPLCIPKLRKRSYQVFSFETWRERPSMLSGHRRQFR
jgi:hypothetical protein